MTDHMIHSRPFQAPKHRLILIKGGKHLGRYLTASQLLRGNIIDFLQRKIHVYLQDINLVRIPQYVAETGCPPVQSLRNPVGAVPCHGRTQQFVLPGIADIIPDPV